MGAYKLAVAPIAEFPVKLAFTDGGSQRTAEFRLQAKRMSEPELRAVRRDTDKTTADILVDQVVGWQDQTLVLDETGKPAAYSPEALLCLLSLPGAANVCFDNYIRAIGVEGKRGN